MNRKTTLEDKVYKFIEENSIISQNDSVLVAFSGGADSVCLLNILNELKDKFSLKLYAAHLNHQLRYGAADHDEKFCVNFCKNLDIPCFVFSEDVGAYAKSHNISEELAGRELRYKHFYETMSSYGISKLAVGHHLKDQAETIMLHLMRGSGIDGLSGMRAIRGNIIRPLLCISKEEILDYCEQKNLSYCTDETNFEAVYRRNKIRLELIPKMHEFNENILASLANTADILSVEADFLEEYADCEFKRIYSDGKCNIDELLSLHLAIQRRIIIKMIAKAKSKKTDISLDYVNKILNIVKNRHTGKSINIGDGFLARIEYENLVIEHSTDISEFYSEIQENKITTVPYQELDIFIKNQGDNDFLFPENPKFSIRTKIDGDRFCPIGMSGSKKLKDFFIDEKIPRPDRQKTIILLCNNEIVLFICRKKIFYDRRFYNKGNGNYSITITERDDFAK